MYSNGKQKYVMSKGSCSNEKKIVKLLASRRRGERTSNLKDITLFSNFRKIKQIDMFGSDVRRHHRISNSRSKVEELVVAENIVLSLTRTGLCVAFDRDTKKVLTTLNASDHSLVRSIFHNRSLSSIIIVSVSEHDSFAALNCEEIKLDDIKSRKSHDDSIVPRRRLFIRETLRWPAFIEFVYLRLFFFPCSIRISSLHSNLFNFNHNNRMMPTKRFLHLAPRNVHRHFFLPLFPPLKQP